jgi:hypothetical protein
MTVAEKNEHLNKYKSVVLTGSSEQFLEDGKDYLLPRAKDTFLRNSKTLKRFPFIGIIRIKIDYHFLLRFLQDDALPISGIKLSQLFKKYLEKKKDTLKTGRKLECLVVDSYDNDELIAVAFADSIFMLDEFFKTIRRTNLSDLQDTLLGELDKQGIPHNGIRKLKKKEALRHACTSCHMSYGYDIGFSFTGTNEGFFDWDREKDLGYSINCLFEPKPGHRHELSLLLKTHLKVEPEQRTITGGSMIQLSLPLERVETLHLFDKSIKSLMHSRRIKLTLNDNRESEKEIQHRHPSTEKAQNQLDNKSIQDIKIILQNIGVSKTVREKTLSLLDLYNDCERNHLQTYYFKRLKCSVEAIKTILESFQKDEEESLLDIEKKLNEEVSALHTAFYNRMRNKMSPNAVLEYGGGIQQFIQAFGFAYKEIIRVLSPGEAERNYSLITSVSKESSMRTHAELNINHILYPQLFCVTTWKEASNFTLRLFDENQYSKADGNPAFWKTMEYYGYFRNFLQNKEDFDGILNLLLNQTELVRNDPVFLSLESTLTPEILKYSLQDYLVYHFAFQRDFKLMWRFYMKVFLQTPSVYRRRGQVKRRAFLFHLFRLFLVAYRETDPIRSKVIKDFINEQRYESFDHLLSNIWFECFDKVDSAARKLCQILTSYSYTLASEDLILYSEYNLININGSKNAQYNLTEYLLVYLSNKFPKGSEFKGRDLTATLNELNAFLEARKAHISTMAEQIIPGSSFDSDRLESKYDSPDNTICLIAAFLIAIDRLDREGKENRSILLHSVPRRPTDGDVDFDAIKIMAGESANLLADPIGGFIVPDPKVRKKYFAYRTLLYRTLWDWSYMSTSPVYGISDSDEERNEKRN